MSYNSKIPRHR